MHRQTRSALASDFKRPGRILALFALTLGGISTTSAFEHGPTGQWELVRNDGGVEVYRRTVGNSPLHEFQGTGMIEAPVTAVLGVLDDVDHRLEWMAEAVAQTLISRSGDRDQTFYSRTGAPWPVSDRDVVIRAVTSVDMKAKMVKIEMNSVEHPTWPPQKGVVRMPHLCGHWFLWPSNGGKWTRVEYQVHADPGGSLPTSIINTVSKKIPYHTIVGVQKQVVKRKYPEYEQKLAQMPEYKEVLPLLPGLTVKPAAAPSPSPSPTPAAQPPASPLPAGTPNAAGGGK